MTRQLLSAKPAKSKRRKSARARSTTREPSPGEVLYEVRDILDEKYDKGRLLYKVDWADNPTTGERYDPTWEPAENVTEAAVADWERQKGRRQRPELQSPSAPLPSVESDSHQHVPSPNLRPKRRRNSRPSEDGRVPKRPRRSVDSGYTSTDGDPESSWAVVPSVPKTKGELVCEFVVPPGFDPSQYLVISSSQSAPASQAVSSGATSSQAEGSPHVGPVSQRSTIPDSQDNFDSLRTQSILGTGLSQHPSQQTASAREAAENEQYASSPEGQTSRSKVDIPSRQLEGHHEDPRQSLGLLESHETAQASHPSSLRPEQLLGGQQIPSEDSPWGEGFLTQPEYDLPASWATAGSSRTLEASPGHQGLTATDQGQERTGQSGLEPNHSFLSASGSRLLCEAAQRVSLPGVSTGHIRTQSSGIPPPDEDLPQTPHRALTGLPPSQNLEELLSSPIRLHLSTSSRNNNSPQPVTPQNRNMDGTPQETPRSGVEIMRQLGLEVFGASPEVNPPAEPRPGADLVSPTAISPAMGNLAQHFEESSSVQPHEHSVLDTSSKGHPLDMDPLSMPPPEQRHGMEFEELPKTVAPADLTTSVGNLHGADDDLSAGEHPFLGGDAEHLAQPSADVQRDHFPLDMEDEDEEVDEILSRHFTVTLPMAANTRSIYLETIAENKPTMIEFGQFFSGELLSDGPDASLVAKLDAIFERLLNLCDLPAYDDSIPELNKEEMKKHATNSNSKYSFVYEFLSGLDDLNTRILILSQPGRVFEYLEAVISASGFPYTVLGQDGSGQSLGGLSVVLAVAGQDLSRIRGGIDIVIAFDHVARSIDLPANLGYEAMPPIVLSLVTTYSLEHIDQQLQSEPGLDGLERKNALNLATGAAREHVRNPEYLKDSKGHYPEPHSIAKIFSDFLRNPEGGLVWEPHPLPSEIVEVWLSQTQESQDSYQAGVSGGRKRHLDSVIEEGTSKRARLLLELRQPSRTATPAQMSDLLKQTLAKHRVSRAGTPVVEVPIDQLEQMAGKIAELEGRIAKQAEYETRMRDHMASLESQLRSWEKTVRTLQPKYMEAIGDRGTFEKECQAAVMEANAATERLEAQKADNEALKEKNKLLESKLAEANDALANSTVPEIAKLAQAEKACHEALAKVEKLEKKLQHLQDEADYARDAYQRASNAHTSLNQEHQELVKKVADLERRASENLLRIHQIHAQNEISEVGRQIDELQALLENRERELDRAKEELKILKNGRRETRQGSVPRSPRTGVMSPRPGRGMGGAGSRGTSPAPLMSSDGLGSGAGGTPVPGMTFLPNVGNGGRWGHLRD
ncbi:hypothetical protein VTI74DRAFT_7439 [Chaetomium olivicolor]